MTYLASRNSSIQVPCDSIINAKPMDAIERGVGIGRGGPRVACVVVQHPVEEVN